MTHLSRTLLALLCFASAASISAQQSEIPNKPSAKAGAVAERRAKAVSLLISLAADVRNFRDARLRARTNAHLADALWDADPDQGRALFRKAWDAAEIADRESQQKLQEEVARQKAETGGGYSIDLPPNLRRQVLKLTARHDGLLAEEFLEKLKAQKQEAANATARQESFDSSDALGQRLGVAQELLEAGEVERALQFADPSLGIISKPTIDFLSHLRERNPSAADQRYAGLLANANAGLQADHNTISLLASYLFTPHSFLIVTPGGTSVVTSAPAGPINVSPQLRAAFFQTAAAVLLRPSDPADPAPVSAGVDGKYLILKRLMPFFEQFAPAGLTAVARGQLEALAVAQNVQRDDVSRARSDRAEVTIEEQEKDILDRINRARTSAERDELYLQLAFRFIERDDQRARDYVNRIEESELRKKAQAYIDTAAAINSVNKNRTERALEIARTGDLTHIQRAWVFTRCAKLLAKTDREKSLALLDEAAAEARRIEPSDPDRARGLIAVASVLQSIDRTRAWDAAFEAAKAANSAERFTGEDGNLVVTFRVKGHLSVYSNDVADFDLAGFFRELAREDYDRAVELTRSFEGEAPRAVATLIIAREVLSVKKK